jgi:hypothetical protein
LAERHLCRSQAFETTTMPGRRKHVALSKTSRLSPSIDGNYKPLKSNSGIDLMEPDYPSPTQNAGKNSRLPCCQAGST